MLVEGTNAFSSLWELAHPTPTYLLAGSVREMRFDRSGSRLIANDGVWDVLRPLGRYLLRHSAIQDTGMVRLEFGGPASVWASCPGGNRPMDSWPCGDWFLQAGRYRFRPRNTPTPTSTRGARSPNRCGGGLPLARMAGMRYFLLTLNYSDRREHSR